MKNIKAILDQKGGDVVSVRPEQTVAEAVEMLVERRIGCVIVLEADGQIAGILTERDVLRSFRNDPSGLGGAKVADHMTTDIVCAVPEDELDYVMSMMTENRFRRMPVMEGDRLVGLITIGDVVKALKSAKEYENRQLKAYIAGGYA